MNELAYLFTQSLYISALIIFVLTLVGIILSLITGAGLDIKMVGYAIISLIMLYISYKMRHTEYIHRCSPFQKRPKTHH